MYCHAEEVGHAKREYRENASVFDVALRSWRPRVAVWGIHLLRRGGLTGDGIPTAQPLTAEAAAGCRVNRWRFSPRDTPAVTARMSSTVCWPAAMR